MNWAISRNEMKTGQKICSKATQYLIVLIQDCPLFGLPLRSQKERKNFAVIYNISDYLHLVSKSKTVKIISALAPDKESWCFWAGDSLGPKAGLYAEYIAPTWNRSPSPHNQTRSPFVTRTDLFQFRLTLSDPSPLNPITVQCKEMNFTKRQNYRRL